MNQQVVLPVTNAFVAKRILISALESELDVETAKAFRTSRTEGTDNFRAELSRRRIAEIEQMLKHLEGEMS